MRLLKDIKQHIPDLELLAKQVVDGFIIGLHKSPFHGFSVEFAEHRLYNRGDNLRHVDWKVYGRSDKMFSKKYEEETNLRCCIAIDTSASMQFRSQNGISKLESGITGAACLIELLRRQMDASSLALFHEQLYLLTRSGTSMAHRNSLYGYLEDTWKGQQMPAKNNTRIAKALHELAERLHKRSLVVLFSDLMETPGEDGAIIDAIQHLKHNKHEVLIFMVGDKLLEWDFDLPDKPLELKDMETEEIIRLQPASVYKEYKQALDTHIHYLSEQCSRMNVDFVLYNIGQDPAELLRNYLLKRKKLM